VQDGNAGNAGDLGKHGAYLSLLATLRRTPPWRGALDVIEAHAGKGLYVPSHAQWRTFQELGHQEHVPLVSAQIAVTAPEPVGIGPILDLQADEYPYAGSSVLHASVLSSCPNRSLVCYDRDANVRETLQRVLGEPCFDAIRGQVAILNPGRQGSEPVILKALQGGTYGRSHVLHLDPFAFLMSKDDQPTRDLYHDLIGECDARVADERLCAASVFLTWGTNGRAAKDDLFEGGHRGVLRGGFQDLRGLVRPTQRIVVAWCWMLYFSLIVIVPERLRDDLGHSLTNDLARLAACCKYFAIS
jgi:hypothetical protein